MRERPGARAEAFYASSSETDPAAADLHVPVEQLEELHIIAPGSGPDTEETKKTIPGFLYISTVAFCWFRHRAA